MKTLALLLLMMAFMMGCKKEDGMLLRTANHATQCHNCYQTLQWTPIPFNSAAYETFDTLNICAPAFDTLQFNWHGYDTCSYQAIGHDGNMWNVFKITSLQ